MGEKTLRFWMFGWRLWPYRSAHRHYFLFRNAARLCRKPYVHSVWKAWAVAKLMFTVLVHSIFDQNRVEQSRAMIAGVRAGALSERNRRLVP
jgi:rhamnosyltransferase